MKVRVDIRGFKRNFHFVHHLHVTPHRASASTFDAQNFITLGALGFSTINMPQKVVPDWIGAVLFLEVFLLIPTAEVWKRPRMFK